jgi:ABC-2 type transport system ATP-binding protein
MSSPATTAAPSSPRRDIDRTDDPIVVIEGLRRSFGDTEVLRGIDLEVRRATVCALLGPNGAGKTTIINILSTLLLPDAGRATVAGHDVATEPNVVKRSISLTGQYAAVDDVLTGEENLVLVGRLAHLGRGRARSRAAELLEQFDLADAARKRVGTYSGGMRRRLDIAAGLVAQPPVIFLDEPTTGLDPRARRTMWEMLDRLVADGTTVLLTTQYLEEADRLADRIAVLAGGRIVAEGTPAELKQQIPGEQVELGFADGATLDEAVVALADPSAVVDRERSTVRVATDGSPAAVRMLLDQLARHAIAATSLDLHRPTLDDVFFLLTGRPTPGPTDEPPGATTTTRPTTASAEGADAR